MAERAFIGLEEPDGTVRFVYCHTGAPPPQNGRVLARHYAGAGQVRALLALGDLSRLGRHLSPPQGVPHSFDAPARGVTVAYHRDRGEPLEPPRVRQGRGELLQGEWAYLFVESSGEWLACKGAPEPGTWGRLADLLGMADAAAERDVAEFAANLRAITDRVNRTSERPSRDQLRRRDRATERRNRPAATYAYTVEAQVADPHGDALEAALESVGVEASRADGEATVLSVAAAGTRDELKRIQTLVTLAAARVASTGVRVDVRGPRIPREIQILDDRVVEPGTSAVHRSNHRAVLRRLAEFCPDEAHPLASRAAIRRTTGE